MDISPARLAANRSNALRSTGPKTDEGKERSRGNAFKHGMSGGGIALPGEDEAEVSRVFAALEAQFAPESDVDRSLVRRVALMTIRLDRCAVNDASATSARVLAAESDFDEGRLAEVERLMGGLGDDPAAGIRQLKRTAEGVDRLVATWRALGADLACEAEDRWTDRHRLMAENLGGRRPGDFGTSRVEALTRAIRGDFALIGPGECPGLDEEARMAWARARLAERIEAEVAGLLAHRETLDLDLVAKLRALAPGRALFDASKPAQLARRYEAEAERGLYRALRELRGGTRAESAPARASASPPRPAIAAPVAGPGPVAIAQADILASFRGAVSAGILPPPKAEKRRPDPSRARQACDARRVREGSRPSRDATAIVAGRG